LQPLELAAWLQSVVGNSTEHALFLGAKERVASRLVASRVPETIVNERGSIAKKQAKKKGSTPSNAHLALWAWNLCITNVPHTLWKTETVGKVYPIRWQIELIFKSWKRDLHLAAIHTKQEDSTVWYLYGRMLLILLHDALCPQLRSPLWLKKKRELSVLTRVRHFQALAEPWMQAIVQSELALHHFLQRACESAERVAVKASRRRQTTAHILRESLRKHSESVAFVEAVNA